MKEELECKIADKNKEKIIEALKADRDGEIGSITIADRIGVDCDTTPKYIKEMVEDGLLVKKEGKGKIFGWVYYTLNDIQ